MLMLAAVYHFVLIFIAIQSPISEAVIYHFLRGIHFIRGVCAWNVCTRHVYFILTVEFLMICTPY